MPVFRTCRDRAYTLIELLLVIMLLGIATAVVAPSLGSTDVLRVQSTVRAIVADINVAQSDALARQQGRAIVFDTTNNRYSVLEVHGATLNPSTDTIYTVDLNNKHKFHSSHLDSAAFDSGNTLVFDELGGPVTGPGSSTPGNGGSVVVSGSGSTFRITVEAYTGRVTVTRIGGP
jgi:prepilin-type N-terminal cleavage/methylation domain-containing protein